MPYIPNIDDEEQPGQGAVTPGASGTHLSSSTVGGTSGGSGAPAANSNAGGGQFATLQSYLGANQGQAAPLVGKITSGVSDQYNTLQGQNQSTLNGIGSQVSAGGVPANATDTLAKEAANPVSFSGDQNNVKQFQSLLNGSYGGPASAEGTGQYQQQQANINSAISTGVNQANSDAGRKQLLEQNEARPTTGVTALNSAILTQAPDYLSKVQDAYKPFNSLLSDLSTGAQGIDSTIGKTQGDVQTASTNANKQIADQVTALDAGVNKQLGGLQDKYGQYNGLSAALGSGLQSGKLPAGYGVDPALQQFIDSNLTPWISSNSPGYTPTYNFANAAPQFPNASAPTLNQAATSGDFATFNALNSLKGAPVESVLGGLDPTLAGTYSTPALPNVDNKALAGDIAAGFGANPANVSAGAYHQYLDLLASLQRYQGLPSTGGPWGPGYGGATDPYGNPIPVIA